MRLYPTERGQAAGFIEKRVRPVTQNHLLAPPTVSKDADEVSHRPADDQQGRLLSHPLSGYSLKTVHRRVLAEHVITKLSPGNGLSHRRCGQSNGGPAQ